MNEMVEHALQEMGCNAESFANENSVWVDGVCERNDEHGTLNGWSFRQLGDLPVVDLVLDHAIISAHLPSLEVFATRRIYSD